MFREDGQAVCRFRWHHQLWDPARRKAGLPRFLFHWLRKTCGQRLLEATGSIAVMLHQLGHAESRTTERAYTRAPLDQLREGPRSVEKSVK